MRRPVAGDLSGAVADLGVAQQLEPDVIHAAAPLGGTLIALAGVWELPRRPRRDDDGPLNDRAGDYAAGPRSRVRGRSCAAR